MSLAAPVMTPRKRQAGGCCVAAVVPDLQPQEALEMAILVKALSQAAVAKHLKVLTGAGVLGAERRGAWTYYYLRPEALEELRAWLS